MLLHELQRRIIPHQTPYHTGDEHRLPSATCDYTRTLSHLGRTAKANCRLPVHICDADHYVKDDGKDHVKHDVIQDTRACLEVALFPGASHLGQYPLLSLGISADALIIRRLHPC